MLHLVILTQIFNECDKEINLKSPSYHFLQAEVDNKLET